MLRNLQNLITEPIIVNIFNAIQKNKTDKVLLVGGVVRDFISSGKISEDIDIATNISPDIIKKRLIESKIQGTILTYAEEYGSVTIKTKIHEITITTFRRDVKTFGRTADVKKTDDIKEDASRRDFTVNAIYVDQNGSVIDFWNGIKDISKKKITFIGDPDSRIKEDYLRILRFFRFSSALTNDYNSTVLEIIKQNLKGLKILSKERITKELCKTTLQPFGVDAIKTMKQNEIFDYLFWKNIKFDFDLFEFYINVFKESLNWRKKKSSKDVSLFDKKTKFSPLNKEDVGHYLGSQVNPLVLFLFSVKGDKSKLSSSFKDTVSLTKSEKEILLFSIKHPSLLESKTLTRKIKYTIAEDIYRKNISCIIANFNANCRSEILDFIRNFKPLPITGKDILDKMNASLISDVDKPKGSSKLSLITVNNVSNGKNSINHKKIGEILNAFMEEWIDKNFTISRKDFLEQVVKFL